MLVERILLENIRVISEAELLPHAHLNLISGPNGAGKSSVLEGLHLLSDGRTFRHALVRPLVRDGQPMARVVGSLRDERGRLLRAGVEKSLDGGTRIRLEQRDVSAIDVARVLPVQLFSRDHGDLIGGGPGNRRRLLDWILFHVEPGFYEGWRRFRRALQQRNGLLRHGRMAGAQLDAWDEEFFLAANDLHRMRARHAGQLVSVLEGLSGLLGDASGSVELDYYAGWDQRRNLAELLSSGRDREIQAGYSRTGPHRADLLLRCGKGAPDKTLSTGQKKLLGWSLRLAAAHYVEKKAGVRPVLLIDEMGADLDRANMEKLAAALAAPRFQVFCASVQESIEQAIWASVGQGLMFHVKHGVVEQAGSI